MYITPPQINLFNPAAYFKLVLFLMQNTYNHRLFSFKKKSVHQSVSSYSRCQNNCKAICLNFNNIWYKKVLKRKNAEHYILYYIKNIIEFLKLEFNYLYLDNNAELLCHFEIFKRLWWYKYIFKLFWSWNPIVYLQFHFRKWYQYNTLCHHQYIHTCKNVKKVNCWKTNLVY